MQSKRSFFNGTLFRKTLTRFWPLWAVPSFIGALFPLVGLTQIIRYGEGLQPLEVTEIYYGVVAVGVPVVSLVYAVLVAAAVWSYLYNSRSVGMMHTIPVDRKGLFATGVLSGMAMMLIPYVVTGGLAIVVTACFGGFDPTGTLVTILAVLGHSLFYFASATAVAFVTGNLIALPVLYFIFHFLMVGLDTLVNVFANGFIFGLNTGYSGMVEWLSPTVYLIHHVAERSTSEKTFTPASHLDGGGYYNYELTSVTLENGWLIAVYALVGILLLAVAYALYRARRSESAGDVVAVGWMKPVFRYGVTLCTALAGGLGLYMIFWGSFQNGDRYDVIPLIAAMLIAGAIGYYAASMLLAKSLRVFRGSGKGLAATAACVLVICGVLHFDVFGVETRVPAVSDVEAVRLYAADNHYDFDPETEGELLEEVRALHRAIAEDADYILDTDESWRYTETGFPHVSGYNSVRFTYELKNGTTMVRRYTVPVTVDRLQDESTYDYALNALVNGQALKEKRFHLNDPLAPNSGSVYLEQRNDSVSFGNREALAVLEGIRRDVAEGTCGNYDWFGLSFGSSYAMDLSLEFQYREVDGQGTDYTAYDYINVTVRPEMTHTVAALLEQKLLTEKDLVTRAELYPESYLEEQKYAKEMAELYGAYDAPYSAPRPVEIISGVSESASIGIIGGADGPTTITVGSTVLN